MTIPVVHSGTVPNLAKGYGGRLFAALDGKID